MATLGATPSTTDVSTFGGVPNTWYGISDGAIAANATPDEFVNKLSTITGYVAGVPFSLSSGNTAAIPAAPSTNNRIDILQSDGTWKSSAEAASPTCPTPDGGTTWLVAVFRRVGDVSDVYAYDDGTHACIYAWHYVSKIVFSRSMVVNQSVTSGSPGDNANGTYIALYLHAPAVLHVVYSDYSSFSNASGGTYYIQLDGTDYISTGPFQLRAIQPASGSNGYVQPGGCAVLASGAHNFQGRIYANSNTITSKGRSVFGYVCKF